MASHKAQSAIDYLMTHGWAVLLIMFVGATLWQLGIFNIGAEATTTTGFGKMKPMLAQTDINAGGSMQTVFMNGLGNPITMDLATVTINDGAPITSDQTNEDIGKNENFILTFSDAGEGIAGGQPATAEITIYYTTNMGGIITSHTETGTIRTLAKHTSTPETTSTTTLLEATTTTSTTTIPACDGWEHNGYCWYMGTYLESCDSVCASHGGCLEENWDDPTGEVGFHFGATSYEGDAIEFPPAPFVHRSNPYVYSRDDSTNQDCSASHVIAKRLCACAD